MSSLKKEAEQNGLYFPNYKNSNLSIITEMANKKGIFSKKDKVILILIDALGFDLLNKIINSDKEILKVFDGAEIKKVSSIFPSFTPSVIASFESGKTIAEHGIVSGKIPIKERGNYVNVFDIPWWPKESNSKNENILLTLFPQPDNLYKMSKNYKKFCLITHEGIWKKNLNSDAAEKINGVPYISFQDMVIQIKKSIKKESGFIYAYTDIIDHAQHVYANSYETFELTRLAIKGLFEVLALAKKEGYYLVITADHGQVSLTKKNTLRISPDSDIMRFVSMPPWGSRAVFIDVMPSMFERFEKFFEKKYEKNFILWNSENAIKEGLFGKTAVTDNMRNRFGTHIAVPKYGSGGMFFSFSQLKNNKSGHHGGLNKEEMEVPLVIFE